MSLLDVSADVVFEAGESGVGAIAFRPTAKNTCVAKPREVVGCRLKVYLGDTAGAFKVLSVPLQVLMTGWGDFSLGFQGYTHTIECLDDDGLPLERWCYIGASSGRWVSRMDELERQVRSGSNRRFKAAWNAYVGASKPLLTSELVVLNQSEDAVLAWEEAQVDAAAATGCCLNVIAGGLKGMQHLRAAGVLQQDRVTIDEREQALTKWLGSGNSNVKLTGMTQILALAWMGDSSDKSDSIDAPGVLTPAMSVAAIRRARAGEPIESILTSLAPADPDRLRQLIESRLP